MHILNAMISMLFGDHNRNILYALILLVSLDYITGVCVAVRKRKLSSSIGAKGIANKVMIFALVSLSSVVDRYFLPAGTAIETVTILFYCANEAISILENAVKMGVPFPAKLTSSLKAFQDKTTK